MQSNKLKQLIFSLIVTMSFCYLNSMDISNVLVFILIFIGTNLFYIYSLEKTDKIVLFSSVILSLLLLMGKFLIYYSETAGFTLFFRSLISFVGSFMFFNRFLNTLFEKVDLVKFQTNKKTNFKLVTILAFLIILCFWIPAWLAEYPGVIPGDTLAQIYQALGMRRINTLNPLIHTLFIKYLLNFLCVFTDDLSKRMFILEFIQMLIHSLIYAYVIGYLYKRTNSKLIVCLSIIFYSLISYNVYYNIAISKDGAYGAFLSLFIVAMDKYLNNQNKNSAISLVVIGTLFSLLRSNGFYSLIVVFMVIAIFVIAKVPFKKLAIMMFVILITSGIIRFPVYGKIVNYYNDANPLTEQTSGHHSNRSGYVFNGNFLYVVPFQQIANVVFNDRELNEKEEWLIEEYIDLEMVKEVYNPILVDPLFSYISNHVKDTRANINDIEYIKLWIELFLKYPLDYLEAYINMNRYYYYPNRYVQTYYQGIPNNDLGLEKEYIISSEYTDTVKNFYEESRKTPVIGSLYSPGVVVYILLIAMTYLFSRKRYISFVCLLAPLFNFLILMAFVPLNDEFRYIFPVVTCLPAIVTMLFINEEEEYVK